MDPAVVLPQATGGPLDKDLKTKNGVAHLRSTKVLWRIWGQPAMAAWFSVCGNKWGCSLIFFVWPDLDFWNYFSRTLNVGKMVCGHQCKMLTQGLAMLKGALPGIRQRDGCARFIVFGSGSGLRGGVAPVSRLGLDLARNAVDLVPSFPIPNLKISALLWLHGCFAYSAGTHTVIPY